MQLHGKTVVLAVTGSIAAYKIVNLARMPKKLGADVQVLMTRNATEFITPLTFEPWRSGRTWCSWPRLLPMSSERSQAASRTIC